MKLIIILVLSLLLLSGCTETELLTFTTNITDTSLDIANKTMVWADTQNNMLDCAFEGRPISECE